MEGGEQRRTIDRDFYRAMVEHAPAMIWSAGLDGRCEYVNAAWLAFTGRALGDVLGDGWQADLHPDDRERYVALFHERLAHDEGLEAEVRLRRHDGTYGRVLIYGRPRAGAGGELDGFVASALELGEHDAGHAEFFEMSLDHMCVAGFDGYWKRLNLSWTHTLGWTPDEMMAVPLIEFVHPDDQYATLSARERLKDGVPLRALANRYRCKDGTYRWFEWRSVSHPGRQVVYAVARDVTAEREAQRALRELTESLTATLDSIREGVISTDPAGAVARMNAVAEKLTGWPAEAAAGRPLAEVFRIARAGAHAVEDAPAQGSEARLVARDGTELPIAFSRAPLRDPEGRVGGAVIVFRDTTAEHAAREAQERMQRQLLLADRMASVGTLAAGVAHEINNPLAYVMANLDLIADGLREIGGGEPAGRAGELVQLAAEARAGAERIRKIVRGLKTFSRAAEERRAVIDLRPVLELSISMVFTEIRHRARLVKDYGSTPLVEADDARLGQVFINLLVNAAQAIPEGDVEGNAIEIATATDAAGHAVVEVRDTGPGIPPGALARIFDPFFTTKPVGVGTGLGLWICHDLVIGLGGQITARNRDEGGAVFRITLPPSAGRVPGPLAAPAREPATPSRRASILVVDDERAIGAMIRRLLREHDVTAVTTGKEALELVLAGTPFDVIVSDLMMPGMSGMELYEEVRRQRPEMAERMVFITGGAFTPAASGFLDRVANARLDKPFSVADLRALVAPFVK